MAQSWPAYYRLITASLTDERTDEHTDEHKLLARDNTMRFMQRSLENQRSQ
jgi:hypothetical protein